MNTTSESLLLKLRDASSFARGEAWSSFAELYTPLIFYWARKIGLQSSDASDLVQDVMTIVYQKLGAFEYDASCKRNSRPSPPLPSWLRAINNAKNWCWLSCRHCCDNMVQPGS